MNEVFNNGVGICIITSKEDVGMIMSALHNIGVSYESIGKII